MAARKALNARRTLLFTWFVTGGGTLVFSILGAWFGRAGLFAGAVLGGVGAVIMSVFVMVRFGWMAPEVRTAAIIGGIIGFLIAAGIAVASLDNPIVPVLSCALSGAGVLMGVGYARKA